MKPSSASSESGGRFCHARNQTRRLMPVAIPKPATCSVCGAPCSRYSKTCGKCGGGRGTSFIQEHGKTAYELLCSDDRMKVLEVDGNGCWLFNGARVDSGYGIVRSGLDKKFYRTHRVVFEAMVRPLDHGEVLDHLCRVPNCCNPAHLEPMQQHENSHRAILDGIREGHQIERMLERNISVEDIAYVFDTTTTLMQGRIKHLCKV